MTRVDKVKQWFGIEEVDKDKLKQHFSNVLYYVEMYRDSGNVEWINMIKKDTQTIAKEMGVEE